jgi:hypothetical protein
MYCIVCLYCIYCCIEHFINIYHVQFSVIYKYMSNDRMIRLTLNPKL